MLRGKERKKRKNRYEKVLEIDEEDLYTLNISCKGKRTVGKANKGINEEKIIGIKIRAKKRKKWKKENRRRKRKTSQNCKSPR